MSHLSIHFLFFPDTILPAFLNVVYLMTIYPMRKDCRWYLGKQRPFGKDLNEYKRYAKICKEKDGWFAQFTEESSRDYYIEILLPFCINGLIEKYNVSRI